MYVMVKMATNSLTWSPFRNCLLPLSLTLWQLWQIEETESSALPWALVAEPSFTELSCSAVGQCRENWDHLGIKSDTKDQISSSPCQNARHVSTATFDFSAKLRCQINTVGWPHQHHTEIKNHATKPSWYHEL